MPWVSIIVTVLSYILAKSNGMSTGKAAAIAGLAGVGTYAFTHNTNAGKSALGKWDGVGKLDATNGASSLAEAAETHGNESTGSVFNGMGDTLVGLSQAAPAVIAAGADGYTKVQIAKTGAKAADKIMDGIPPIVWGIGATLIIYAMVK